LHFGMTIVGLPYSHQGQMNLDEIVGGSTVRRNDGRRRRRPAPAKRSRAGGARHQGQLIAETAKNYFRLIVASSSLLALLVAGGLQNFLAFVV